MPRASRNTNSLYQHGRACAGRTETEEWGWRGRRGDCICGARGPWWAAGRSHVPRQYGAAGTERSPGFKIHKSHSGSTSHGSVAASTRTKEAKERQRDGVLQSPEHPDPGHIATQKLKATGMSDAGWKGCSGADGRDTPQADCLSSYSVPPHQHKHGLQISNTRISTRGGAEK